MNNIIQSIEEAIQSKNHYAALGMALAAPDMCGWVLDPNIHSKKRVITWFDSYLQSKYLREATENRPEHIFLNGSDFYALRCAFLHEGRENISTQKAQEILESFQFVVPPDGWTVHKNQSDNTLQLQVDIFCNDIIEGIKSFLSDISENEDAISRLRQALIIRHINEISI